MKNLEQEIEQVLRRAPAPRVPPGLEQSLVKALASSPRRDSGASEAGRGGFWRRWWPVALPGLAAAAFATAVVVQQTELNALRYGSGAGAGPVLVPVAGVPSTAAEGFAGAETASSGTTPADWRAELERLRVLVATLTAQAEESDRLQADSRRLEAEIAALRGQMPTELQELEALKEKALRIRCVNNLKQLGLAVRIWANDHRDAFPSEIAQLGAFLPSPNVLVCPSDATRQPAPDKASVSEAHCSYDYLSPDPSENPGLEPTRVIWRCTFHRNVTLADGSVQQMTPEWYARIENRDGKLYLPPPEPRPSEAGGSQSR